MEGISGAMKSLCENIITTYRDRGQSIKALKEETKTIKSNTRKFINEICSDLKKTSKSWDEMRKALKSKRASVGKKK